MSGNKIVSKKWAYYNEYDPNAAEWIPCRDGKYRATKPSIGPLAPRFAADVGCGSDPSIEDVENTQEGRMMRLKGYGNAIVAPLAIEFISAVMEVVD